MELVVPVIALHAAAQVEVMHPRMPAGEAGQLGIQPVDHDHGDGGLQGRIRNAARLHGLAQPLSADAGQGVVVTVADHIDLRKAARHIGEDAVVERHRPGDQLVEAAEQIVGGAEVRIEGAQMVGQLPVGHKVVAAP